MKGREVWNMHRELLQAAEPSRSGPACGYGSFTFLPTLTQLRSFHEVAKCGNISRASQILHRSQSTVSEALQNLEAALEVSLFDRTATGCYVNAMGRILELRSQKCFDQIEAAIRGVLAESGKDSSKDSSNAAAVARRVTRGHIQALVAVDESRSFVRASDSVQISPTSLHRSARGLEQHLGVQLFRNSARGVVTTDAGSRLSTQFRLAVRELEWAAEEIRSRKGGFSGRLLVGSLQLLGSCFVADCLDRFCNLHPEVKVFAIHGLYNELLPKLRSGQLDFIFSQARASGPVMDVVHETVALDPFVLVVRRQHSLAGKSNVTLRDLQEENWILPRPGSLRRRIFDSLFRDCRPPHFNVETHTLPTIMVMVSKSDRVALVTRSELAMAQCLGNRLHAIDYRIEAPPATVRLATRKLWEPTRLQQAFLEFVRKEKLDAPAAIPPVATSNAIIRKRRSRAS
jgi:DNA-binding transcriptional LysR family regulator